MCGLLLLAAICCCFFFFLFCYIWFRCLSRRCFGGFGTSWNFRASSSLSSGCLVCWVWEKGPSIVCRVRPVSFVSRSTESKYISPSGYLSSSSSWAYVSHCLCYVFNFCFILLCFILFFSSIPSINMSISASVPVFGISSSLLWTIRTVAPSLFPSSSSTRLSFFCSPRLFFVGSLLSGNFEIDFFVMLR